MAKSAFPNPTEVYTYQYVDKVFPETHPENRSWPDDSKMFFKRYRNQEDDEAINLMTSTFKMRIDREAARKARQNGQKDAGAEMEQQLKMTGALAMILVMNRGWEGEYFVVPQWATTGDGRPHPKRGQLADCNEAWVKKMDPVILQDIEDTLSDLWEPSLADDETFHRGHPSLDGSESVGVGTRGAPVHSGNHGVAAGQDLRVDLLDNS